MTTFADKHNTPEAMDKFWSECDPSYFEGRQEFYEMLAERVVQTFPADPWCIMDVGGVGGRLVYEVYRRASKVMLNGTIVDYSRAGLDITLEFLRKQDIPMFGLDSCDFAVWQYDITQKSPQHHKVVLCSQTLEHIKDYNTALVNLMSAVMDDGKLILTIPNGANDTYGGHHNFWTVDEFRALLEQYGTVETCELMTPDHIIAVVSK